MTSNEKYEKKSRRKYENACSNGYCPNLKERENSGIRELAYRLDATSDKDVLTNVLEWENRNIVFWFERYPLSVAIWVLLALSFFVAVLTISFSMSPLLVPISTILFKCFVALFSAFATLSLVAIYMIHSHRKLPLRQLFNIFPSKLSIDSILENKLCVCRDYAKLTACLLFKMRPERETYFVQAPGHVATGMIVDNRLYILDQRLPVVTIDRWHKRWHTCRFSKKTVEKARENRMGSVDLNCLLSKTNLSSVNTDRLAIEMKSRLSIQSPKKDTQVASMKILHWKKGAVLYEDDEIVNYSLARRLETLLSDEKLDTNQVKNIKIEKKNEDLIFRVDIIPNK